VTPIVNQNKPSPSLNRRHFLQKASLASLSLTVATANPGDRNPPPLLKREDPTEVRSFPDNGKPIKLFCCDLNWAFFDSPIKSVLPAAPQDWAFVNPDEYFQWHKDFGVNIMFLQAFTFDGYAFYPTKLGAIAPGPGGKLFPRFFDLSRKAGMPFMAYFCVGTDLIMSSMRNVWVVPTSRNYNYWGYLAPESPWTDLLCARIEEFLRLYPVDWIVFDWFVYGSLYPDEFAVQPEWFVKKPFKEIIGRDMPENALEITPEESLKYKREVLAHQFYRIREAVDKGNRGTKIGFNVPYRHPAESLWVDHPMLNESDMLFAESSDAIVEWLLSIRKPHQRVMTTILGRPNDKGVCDPNTWRKWYARGCDFFAYAWGTPPDFRPNHTYAANVEIVRQAYKEIHS
jgi:hypothetical protein